MGDHDGLESLITIGWNAQTYTAKLDAMYRTAAHYCDKILRGADPAELPVEQPTIFEMVLNLKTAGALGLSLPEIVLVRADRVIE